MKITNVNKVKTSAKFTSQKVAIAAREMKKKQYKPF